MVGIRELVEQGAALDAVGIVELLNVRRQGFRVAGDV
jgi:hypothetical protein